MGDETAMPKDTALLDEIGTLLDEPASRDPRALLARVEYVLTTGYARAHALEAERWRLDREIGRLAATLDERDAATVGELKTLAARASAADDDRTRLLDRLSSLRARASILRA